MADKTAEQSIRDSLGSDGGFIGPSVDEFEEENTELKRQVATDFLTNLASRQEIEHRLEQVEDGNLIATMLMVDVDNFKTINDSFGHAVGDTVMEVIGTRINARISRKNDLAGRWGGDEIVVVFEGYIEPKILTKRAEEIRASFEKDPISYESNIIPITFSIGMATRKNGEVTDDWFKRTDMAEKAAKQNGRNQVVVAE